MSPPIPALSAVPRLLASKSIRYCSIPPAVAAALVVIDEEGSGPYDPALFVEKYIRGVLLVWAELRELILVRVRDVPHREGLASRG